MGCVLTPPTTQPQQHQRPPTRQPQLHWSVASGTASAATSTRSDPTRQHARTLLTWAVDSSAIEPEVLKFGCTRQSDQFLWTAKDAVGLGGGSRHGAYGLWLDKFLASGTTATCDAFGNPALCEVAKAEPERSFSVELIEVCVVHPSSS